MGSDRIRLDEDVYERLRARKREGESFSAVIDRLLDRRSLSDLEGVWSTSDVEELDRELGDVDDTAMRDVDAVIDTEDGR